MTRLVKCRACGRSVSDALVYGRWCRDCVTARIRLATKRVPAPKKRVLVAEAWAVQHNIPAKLLGHRATQWLFVWDDGEVDFGNRRDRKLFASKEDAQLAADGVRVWNSEISISIVHVRTYARPK